MKFLCHRLVFFVALTPIVVSPLAWASTIRYELPQLIGEHRFDGNTEYHFGQIAHVDTPFGFYSVAEARLVVEGSVTAGKAHGDGIIRQALEFALEPSVSALPSFVHSLTFSTKATIGEFRIGETYAHPFAPETIPLPNPDGYPPLSFDVRFAVGPSFVTNYPPAIEPRPELLRTMDGIIVDVPIVANVTTAYIVMEGPGVVPEPDGAVIAFFALVIIGLIQRVARTLSGQFAMIP